MTLKNEQLNIWTKEKHELIRSYEKKEIDENTFNEELKRIEEQLNSKTKEMLNEINKQKELKKIEEEKKTKKKKEEKKEEEKVEKTEEVKKVGKKVQTDSYASVIGKVLELKTVKNIDDAVTKVDELKPGRDKPKIKTQINAIIRETQAGKGRWSKYNWDNDNFLLTAKE